MIGDNVVDKQEQQVRIGAQRQQGGPDQRLGLQREHVAA